MKKLGKHLISDNFAKKVLANPYHLRSFIELMKSIDKIPGRENGVIKMCEIVNENIKEKKK